MIHLFMAYLCSCIITGQMKNKPETLNPNVLNYISWLELPKYAYVFQHESHSNHFHRLLGKQSYLVAQPLPAVKQDLLTAKNLLHAHYFAYPYGQYNDNTINILKEIGIRMAFTTKVGRVYPGSPEYELNRNAVYPYTTMRQFMQIVRISSAK
nr:polysaccharide deacetylase family protein [Aneurinibacillus terranovensis]